MNHRTPRLNRLLTQLRGLVTVDVTEVNRRDLGCAHHSEVQLELDFKTPSRQAWRTVLPQLSK